MRPDMIPGASFPDYELSDHRGQRRRLSSLQQGDPLVLVLSRGGYVRGIGASTKVCCHFIVRCRLAIVGWSRFPPTTRILVFWPTYR